MYQNRHITVVIPALNEEPSIAQVVDGLFAVHLCDQCSNVIDTIDTFANVPRPKLASTVFCDCQTERATSGLVDQVIVADNGSTDQTGPISATSGAMVVKELERGYGAACLAALSAPVKKDIVVFVDGDHSVAANEIPSLLAPIVNGADLVIGSRTLGHCEKGALTVPQALGNRLAIILMRLLWGGKVTDLGPFRAITQEALTHIQMSDRKFGWTVEMQIRALQLSLTTVEVPVSTHRRIGKSKISGTIKGVLGAANGILGTIGKLYWRQISGAYKIKSGDTATKPPGKLPS